MRKSLIQKITRRALDEIKNKKTRPLLLIIMGGDREVDTALREISVLSQAGVNFKIYLTFAARRIITQEKILNFCPGEIISDSDIWNRSILDEVNGIIVPVLTLNGLSKIANMIADNPATNIILLAIREQKKILIARDSVVCCGGPEPPATGFFMRKINEMINNIKNMGAKVTVAKNLSRSACEMFNMECPLPEEGHLPIDIKSGRSATGGRSAASEMSAAGNVKSTKIHSSPCGDDVDFCVECGLCVVNREDAVQSIIDAGASRISAKQVSKAESPPPGVIEDLASYIDHTALKADVTQEEIGKLCEEAKKYSFATVCVNPSNVKLAVQLLRGTNVGVTTVIGFPLGATTPTTKAIEARDAIASGADEIDMVINVGALKSGNYGLVEDDMKVVREATIGKVLKVILETALLSKEQIIKACQIAKSVGADFVKTSTGFGPGGAKEEDVRLMRETVGPSMGVKASGGIRTSKEADAMLKAGASRLGVSASIAIVTGKEGKGTY